MWLSALGSRLSAEGGQEDRRAEEGWRGGRMVPQSSILPVCQPPTSSLPTFYVSTLLFACVLLLSTAYGAPDVPLNFDGWVTEALAKLETDGITGGFHRHTAPLSRADVTEVIERAESRIRTGVVVPSAIDRKLLEKLKRAFAKERMRHEGRSIGFHGAASGDRGKTGTRL